MQSQSKIKLSLILSLLVHISAVVMLYQLANQISFLDPISMTDIDLSTSTAKPAQRSLSPKITKPRTTDIVKEAGQDLNQLSENQLATVSELGSDEISNQGQISSPAKLISIVRAQRTAEAKKANYVADAKVLIIVNQQGAVDSAKLLNNLEYGLNEVALDIARKLKFRPARINSVAVRTQIELTINFKSSN